MLYVSIIVFGLCLVALGHIVDKWQPPHGKKWMGEEDIAAIVQPLLEERYAEGVEYGQALAKGERDGIHEL